MKRTHYLPPHSLRGVRVRTGYTNAMNEPPDKPDTQEAPASASPSATAESAESPDAKAAVKPGEAAAPAEERSLEGSDVTMSDEAQRAQVIDQAFDYRGDVSVFTDDGREIKGYLFDRKGKGEAREVRILPSNGGERINVPYRAITRIAFTGKDTAFGRSWEAWVRKHEKLKAAGKEASLFAEELE